MVELDLGKGEVTAECNVMLEEGPTALLLQSVPLEETENNTADWALDMPFAHGTHGRNDIFSPDQLGINDGCADRIEGIGRTPLGRNPIQVALPVVSLDTQKNRDQVYY